MKPGDHPEFFRLPPPEGRSRESSIVLTRDGRFFHDGAQVTHPGMHRAFASWLTRHPDDGRFILSNGYDWTYLTVEGPARFVQGVRGQGGHLSLELLDGTELVLEASRVLCDEEGRLWARLPEGELACFTGSAQLALAPWLAEQAGVVGLRLGDTFVPIGRADPEALAGSQRSPRS